MNASAGWIKNPETDPHMQFKEKHQESKDSPFQQMIKNWICMRRNHTSRPLLVGLFALTLR